VEHYEYRSEGKVDDIKHNSNKKWEGGGFVTELQNLQVQKWQMKNICVSASKYHEFTSRQTLQAEPTPVRILCRFYKNAPILRHVVF
jgi:hypothetical protein